jgi:hypothetical protein
VSAAREVGGLPPAQQTEQLLGIMRQAETVRDLWEFCTASRTQSLARQLPQHERLTLAAEYDILSLRLKYWVKFDDLDGKPVIIYRAAPRYDERRGAEVIDLEGTFEDGRRWRTSCGHHTIVRQMAAFPAASDEAPQRWKFYKARSREDSRIFHWRAWAPRPPDPDPTRVNPFMGGQ